MHETGGGEDGQGEGLEDGGNKHGPNGHRQAEHGHTGGAHLNDGGHVVDRAHHRRDANQRETDDPEKLAIPSLSLQDGEGRIVGPTSLGGPRLLQKS